MSKELERELENLKRMDQISDWSKSLGYGDVEYTIDLNPALSPNLKALAKTFSKTYGAHNFQRFVDGSAVAVKFVVTI